jgi:hypothetical protein
LIQIPDSDFHLAVLVGKRSEISQMAITTDPDRWAGGKPSGGDRIEPFVELYSVATYVSRSRPCHFEIAALVQLGLTMLGLRRWGFHRATSA